MRYVMLGPGLKGASSVMDVNYRSARNRTQLSRIPGSRTEGSLSLAQERKVFQCHDFEITLRCLSAVDFV